MLCCFVLMCSLFPIFPNNYNIIIIFILETKSVFLALRLWLYIKVNIVALGNKWQFLACHRWTFGEQNSESRQLCQYQSHASFFFCLFFSQSKNNFMRKQFQIKFWPTEIFVRCLDLFLEKTEFARIHEGTGLKTFQFVLGIIVNVTKKNWVKSFLLRCLHVDGGLSKHSIQSCVPVSHVMLCATPRTQVSWVQLWAAVGFKLFENLHFWFNPTE